MTNRTVTIKAIGFTKDKAKAIEGNVYADLVAMQPVTGDALRAMRRDFRKAGWEMRIHTLGNGTTKIVIINED